MALVDVSAHLEYCLPFSDDRVTDNVTDGFFDAGMLLQALKAKQGEGDGSTDDAHPRRPTVGKKLALTEY